MAGRLAIYVVPDGDWGAFGADWLGWDIAEGQARPIPDPAQDRLTARPRKYGFHGTVKAPFTLAEGQAADDLCAATRALCARLAPVPLPSLRVTCMGRFFALTAPEEHEALQALAARVVRDLDTFRAPPTEAEIARRRRQGKLSPAQDALLLRWGYPFVMEAFHFHLTLTGPVPADPPMPPELAAALAHLPDAPLVIDSLCLSEEGDDGFFRVRERVPLTGPGT